MFSILLERQPGLTYKIAIASKANGASQKSETAS